MSKVFVERRRQSAWQMIHQIRRLILAELPYEIIVVLIAAVVFPAKLLECIKK